MYDLNENRNTCGDNGELTKITSEEEAKRILEKFGKFQIYSLFLLCPAFMIVATVVMTPVFLNIIPTHQCKDGLSNSRNINFSLLSNFSRSSREELECSRWVTFSNLSEPFTNESFTYTPCSEGWIYDLSFGNTVVSQFDLVCGLAWKRPFALASLIAGTMVGSIGGGPLSDRYGRKRMSLVTFAVFTLLQLIASFVRHYWIYAAIVFFIGVMLFCSHIIVYVWAQELVHSADKRALANFVLSASFGVGGMLSSLIAYLVMDWDWMFRVLAIISALCFPLLCVVPESPIWLLQNGQTKNGLKILKKIAAINGINVELKCTSIKSLTNATKTNQERSKNQRSSPLLLLRNKVLRQRQLLVCFLWLIAYSIYTIMIYNSGNLGGNVYINHFIGCALDVASVVLSTVMLKKYSRRNTMVFLFTMIVISAISSPFVKKAHLNLGIVFAQIGRFFCTSTTWTLLLYNGEIFPTILRNTSIGIGTLSGKLLSVAAPFLLFAGEELDLSIPFYVVSGMSILGLLATLLLPETPKNFLPDSLEEALALKDAGLRSMQCFCLESKISSIKPIRKRGCGNPTNLSTIA